MTEKTESKSHIIIDNGTGYCKSGFSGEKEPRSIIPACVGYQKYGSGRVGFSKKEFFVGPDVEPIKGVLKINNPLNNGVVNNWDDMEKIWRYIFIDELKIKPEEHNVLLTETPMDPRENREKMGEIMFETFGIPGLFFASESILTLFSQGKHTGMVADSGDGITYFDPIFYGCSLIYSLIRLNFGGRDLTEYMMKLLNNSGKIFSTDAEKEILKNIKEKSCYAALNYEEELKNVREFNYELPDGNNVIIKEQRIKCPEALFKPNLIGKEGNGIAQNCLDSIQKCNIDIRKEISNFIFLSGGNSMYNGLPERFTKELKNLAPEPMKEEINVISPLERRYSVWIGGSLFSSTSLESNWITKTEYKESGVINIHRKCS